MMDSSKSNISVFTWVFVVLAAAVFLFLAIFVVLPSLEEIQNTAALAKFELALRGRDNLENVFERYAALLRETGRNPSLPAMAESLREVLSLNPALKYFVIYSPSGQALWNSGDFAPPLGENFFSENGLAELATRGFAVSPAFRSPEGELLILISVPASGPAATLSAAFNLGFVWNLLSEIRLDTSDVIYVVDAEGKLVAHQNAVLISEDLALKYFSPVKEILLAGETRGLELKSETFFKDRQVLVSAARLETLPWWLVVESPSSEVLAVRDRVVLFAAILILGGIILLTLLIRNSAHLIKTTRALKAERDHVVFLINTLTDGIIEYDADFRVRLMNPKAEEIFGLKLERVRGAELAASSDHKFKNLYALLSADDQKQKQFVLEGPSEKIYLELSTISFSKEGKTSIKILHDISRDVFLGRVKSEFISVAAHQLRTPLSGIKWASRVLLEGEGGALEPKQKEYLEKIYESNERMISLVSDLLDASRIEEGRFGYDFKENDFHQMLAVVLKSFEDAAQKRAIRLELKTTLEPLPKFTFDSQRIGYALSNIIDNAIRYTNPGGRVTVELLRKNAFLEVGVSDTGVGIPEAEKSRVFTKFFRGGNVIKLQTEGSGLGLFIAKNIIKRHGGDVGFVSEIGKGSRFYFTLPLKREYIPAEEARPLAAFPEAV